MSRDKGYISHYLYRAEADILLEVERLRATPKRKARNKPIFDLCRQWRKVNSRAANKKLSKRKTKMKPDEIEATRKLIEVKERLKDTLYALISADLACIQRSVTRASKKEYTAEIVLTLEKIKRIYAEIEALENELRDEGE